MTHGNCVVTTYQYDAASQLTRLAHQLGATTINSFDYTYDKIGNRKTKVDRNNGSYNYTYDTLNRLTQALNPLPSNPLENYTYDPVGNRTNSNQNGLSSFNQANQLTEDVNFTYQYDANGNQTRKTAKVGGAFNTYEYDAENKLVRAVSNGTVANYKYDGLGRRVEKEVTQAGVTKMSRYIYDNEDILLELDGSNTILARYTHGPGIDEPLIMEKAGQSFFYHADGLGSITEISNATGSVVQRYNYSSFGKIESQLDPMFVQPYTFTSREFDTETGLYFYRARVYDALIGRFLQEDPVPGLTLLPQTLNKFPYVGNEPVNNIDPTGEVAPVLLAAGTFVLAQIITVGAVYTITATVAALNNIVNCDRKPITKADLNRAFFYAQVASLAPAVELVAIAGAYVASQVAAAFALLNPIGTYEFVENVLSPGPPQPASTMAPYYGTIVGQIIQSIYDLFSGK